MWDLEGKAAGGPVYRLLGGKVRDKLPIKMVIGAFEIIANAVELAGKSLEWGAVHLKVKVGLNPVTDTAHGKAVREVAGPAVTIGVDGNCGWGLATAKRSLQALENFGLRFAEQLVDTENLDALAQLRTASTVQVMADESVFTPTDAWHLTTARAADVLAVYPGKNAGIAEAADICCCMSSNLELGIATAANAPRRRGRALHSRR